MGRIVGRPEGWSAAGGAFMGVTGATAGLLWADSGHSGLKTGLAVLATVAAVVGCYWMIAALVPCWPFGRQAEGATEQRPKPVRGIKPFGKKAYKNLMDGSGD